MSDVLAGAGLLLAAAAAAASILLPAGRARSLAMLLALLLFPVLILGDQWHTHQIVDLRHNSTRIALLLAAGALAVAAIAYVLRRWPILLPLAIVAALPFRVPLHAGGDTANLLVPLYLVIVGGVLSELSRTWAARLVGGADGESENGASLPRPQDSPSVTGPAQRAARWVPRLLAAFVLLYALQALYSEDVSKGIQNACFFLVPFTVAYALLQDVEWDRRLLTLVLWVVGVEACLFVAVGTVEYASRSLFWNEVVIRSNDFHTYFRVNSVFWDPNIYGRYLALVIVVAVAPLLWVRGRRDLALLTALVAFLWFGLAQTFSESSYLALLAGLAVLAALRWNWRWTVGAVVVGVIGIGAIVATTGKLRPNIIFSGRADLVEGGLELWSERPLWGYGSGSFQSAYRHHRAKQDTPVSVSHTEPVTVLAEQGLLGTLLYLALLVSAIWTMASGLWASSQGRAPPAGGADGESENGASLPRPQASPSVTGPAGRIAPSLIARAAVLAAFVALLVHTLAYAGFFEDPITWVLLAAGVSLATAAARESAAPSPAAVREPA